MHVKLMLVLAAALTASGCAAPAAEQPSSLESTTVNGAATAGDAAGDIVEDTADAASDTAAHRVADAPAGNAAADAAAAGSTSPNADKAMVYSTMKGKELPNVNAGIIVPSNPASIALGQGTPQLLDFFGFWCGICNAMAPTITATKATYEGPVEYIHLDVDDPANAGYLQQFGVAGTPTFVLLDGTGQVVQQWQGAVDQTEIEAALASIVGGAS